MPWNIVGIKNVMPKCKNQSLSLADISINLYAYPSYI